MSAWAGLLAWHQAPGLVSGLVLTLMLGACTPSPPAPSIAQAVSSQPLTAWSSAALGEVARYAQSQKTTGLLVIENRKVVYEHNWPLSAADERFAANWTHGTDRYGALQEDVASAQKSFIALLAAIAIDKGMLEIHKPVSAYTGPGWSRATAVQENAITVRHLLEMDSGLAENLSYEAPAGSRFFYNTPAYAILKPVLEAASGQSLSDMTRRWLAEPLGMTNTLWRQRPASFGDVGNPTGLYTTPRDMARLGQLVLDQGLSESGQRVISREQLAALFQRSANNPAYGRLWWLNGSAFSLRPGNLRSATPLIPAAPTDLVMALGALDRKIFISPGRRLIVVRTGQAAPEKDFNQQLWLRLMAAANGR